MVTSKRLEDLLKKCTPWPWKNSWSEHTDIWSILAAPNDRRSKVISECPKELSNWDRELMSIAPVLALEVLQLRKKLQQP